VTSILELRSRGYLKVNFCSSFVIIHAKNWCRVCYSFGCVHDRNDAKNPKEDGRSSERDKELIVSGAYLLYLSKETCSAECFNYLLFQ
jgi:hypothetical protein